MGGLTESSSSSSSSRELSPQAAQLYSSYAYPYAGVSSSFATKGLNYANGLLNDSNYGTQNVDYGAYDANAQGQIANAQNIASMLTSGNLPQATQQNMTDVLNNQMQGTMGSAVNNLASRGVINSSTANKALSDIDTAVAQQAANSQSSNMQLLNQLANSQIGMATAPISASSMAQQAAISPIQSLLGLSTNAEQAGVNNVLSALMGTGTQTTDKSESPSFLQVASSLGKLF